LIESSFLILFIPRKLFTGYIGCACNPNSPNQPESENSIYLRAYFKEDTVNGARKDLAFAYLSAFGETCLFTEESREIIDFKVFMREKGMEIIHVSDSEQSHLNCTFAPVKT